MCPSYLIFFDVSTFSHFSRIFLYISYTKWKNFHNFFSSISHCPKNLKKIRKLFFMERIQNTELGRDILNLMFFKRPTVDITTMFRYESKVKSLSDYKIYYYSYTLISPYTKYGSTSYIRYHPIPNVEALHIY